MENKPKKSKALIITLIVVVLLIIAGYLIYKNRDSFGVKTSTSIAKLFSPLTPSSNAKLTVGLSDGDLKKGDGVVFSGTDANGNPIYRKSDSADFGFANQDIQSGELGEFMINDGGTNTFWDSFSGFINDVFNIKTTPQSPGEGWIFDPITNTWTPPSGEGWVFDSTTNTWTPPPGEGWFFDPITNTWTLPSGSCLNGATNPPDCTSGINLFPSVTVTASPSLIGPGEFSTISWSSENTTSCNKGDGVEIGTTGSFETGALTDSSSYTIICTGENGSSSDNAYVVVRGGTNLFPSVTVTASPSSIASGASSTVSWTSVNTTSCNAGAGNSTETSGSFNTGTLTLSKSYAVTCLGNIGFGSGNVFVRVGNIGISPECSDGIDNDGDTTTDEQDSACHIGGDLNKAYIANHFSESIIITSGEPDLVAGFVTPSSTLIDTATILNSLIRNDGEGSTVSGFSSFFTITETSPDEAQTDAANNIELVVDTLALSPGTSSTAKATHTFTKSGTYYIRACADKKTGGDAGTITEINENNNCGAWTTFTVKDSINPPDGQKQCSDSKDNDTDGKIDELDPNCHYDGNINNEYVPDHDSESTSPVTLYQCNDAFDNDNDGKIDNFDPECHMDGDLNKAYVPNHYSELSFPITPVVYEENKCLYIEQNPLTFNEVEQAKLAELLRKFYIIAPTLKTEADITLAYREIETYKTFIGAVDDLTNQCYAQTVTKTGAKNPGYTGPTLRFGNPWYKYEDRGSYIENDVKTGISTCTGDGEHTAAISIFGSGTYKTDCPAQKTQVSCETYGSDLNNTGCTWTHITNIKEYEKILNIW
ncbi:MAG: hypothetical protein JJE53_00305 [Candidatus Pacebacteria bacterium]|nr:hypothetical protein [Candidatus Paceibacterota bacterium]